MADRVDPRRRVAELLAGIQPNVPVWEGSDPSYRASVLPFGMYDGGVDLAFPDIMTPSPGMDQPEDGLKLVAMALAMGGRGGGAPPNSAGAFNWFRRKPPAGGSPPQAKPSAGAEPSPGPRAADPSGSAQDLPPGSVPPHTGDPAAGRTTPSSSFSPYALYDPQGAHGQISRQYLDEMLSAGAPFPNETLTAARLAQRYRRADLPQVEFSDLVNRSAHSLDELQHLEKIYAAMPSAKRNVSQPQPRQAILDAIQGRPGMLAVPAAAGGVAAALAAAPEAQAAPSPGNVNPVAAALAGQQYGMQQHPMEGAPGQPGAAGLPQVVPQMPEPFSLPGIPPTDGPPPPLGPRRTQEEMLDLLEQIERERLERMNRF